MEYMMIIYPERRKVIYDGIEAGEAGEVLEIEAGQHMISLAGPKDYEPNQQPIDVRNTSLLSPLMVHFEKK